MTEQSVCECTPVVGTRFEGERGRPPSLAIIEAVAAAEGISPIELDPLSDEIDLESIDKLLTGPDGTPNLLHFSVNEWDVFVRDDGAIRVCDPNHVTDPEPVFEKPVCD
ncbi:HalOD1 output domain-containing protein [Haloarcula halophila]|uniref:HalOD1 output domain-containing protein n=1 Tax=Haloarcula TaxID=2237 RepID=UPI0023E397AD|nr:HalOD1 output domain-containing protein [Halomicroarcula sp. DFY41]